MELKRLTPTIQVAQEVKDGKDVFYAWLKMPHMKKSRFFVSHESEKEVFSFAVDFEAFENERKQRQKDDQANARKIRAEKDKEAVKNCQPGQIYVESWGYDQTNIDFYQVVSVKGASALIRAIEQNTTETGFMSGKTFPVKDHFKSGLIRKRVMNYGDGRPSFSGCAHGWLTLWDGTPQGCSWYA